MRRLLGCSEKPEGAATGIAHGQLGARQGEGAQAEQPLRWSAALHQEQLAAAAMGWRGAVAQAIGSPCQYRTGQTMFRHHRQGMGGMVLHPVERQALTLAQFLSQLRTHIAGMGITDHRLQITGATRCQLDQALVQIAQLVGVGQITAKGRRPD